MFTLISTVEGRPSNMDLDEKNISDSSVEIAISMTFDADWSGSFGVFLKCFLLNVSTEEATNEFFTRGINISGNIV